MSDLRKEIEKRRTFAIISHPDAGKTTLTEKFLLYGGAINLAGSVKGKATARHAVSDWMDSRFNEFITSRLLSGALDCLRRHEVPEDDITVAWVPGAFEIPLIASRMAASRRYDAVICLGAVIRGSTSHYDYVCSEVSKGIAQASLAAKIPVMFGVLTTENIEQAIERAGTKAGNKGYDCAAGAIEMVNLIHELDKRTADNSLSVTPFVQEEPCRP